MPLRIPSLTLAILLLLPGCDALQEKLGLSDPAPAPSSTVPTASPAPVAALTDAEIAYAAGRKFGMACVFALLGSDGEADASHAQASAAATRLGVQLPPRPGKDEAMEHLRSLAVVKAVETARDREAALAYGLGMKVTDTFLGAALGSDLGTQIGDIETAALQLPVPSSVWKGAVDATRASSTKETVGTLSKAFDTHFRYDESPSGPAWSSSAS
ncbi:MAG: hypothetical protein IPH07_21650 [Deltaproteobacteria bacterium]|nr:hypothetical protein [Deltaproteobacteria bacterium]MBK8714427.1 hypothetical protein [Deltaproteobacteria bacterium]MBP7290747.1 hypothetical protein [Nannocystaceae bacterium]